MTTPAKKRGFAGNVYRNTGSHDTPTFVQVEDAGDIKVADSWKKFEAPNRVSEVIKYLPGMKEWGIEFKMVWDNTNDDQVAIRAAYRTGAAIALFAADGASNVVGTSGPFAEWLIESFEYDMPLQNGMEVSVKACPHANCSFEPEYLVIS